MEQASVTASPQTPVVNAMTVDVEDYFHVSAFEHSVPRSHWDSLESRVVANTGRLLDLFATANIHATFLSWGGLRLVTPD